MKKTLFILFTIVIITGCGKYNEAKLNLEITGINLDEKEITLKSGESYQFHVIHTPSEAKKPQCVWNIIEEQFYHIRNLKEGATISPDGKLTVYSGGSLVVQVGVHSNDGKFFEDRCKINIIPTIDQFYEWHCYGFSLKDTVGILSGKNVYFNPPKTQNDTTYLAGIKNEKIWIGTFNTSTKQQLSEWSDTETISRTQKVHIGYGKFEEFTINYAEVKSFIKDKKDVITELILENNEIINSHNFTILIFEKGSNTKRYFIKNKNNQPLIKWYDNSYLFNIDARKEPYNQGNYYTCFDEGGNIILVGKMPQWHDAKMLCPINFDEYLYFDYGYRSIHISKKTISSGDDLWRKIIMDDFDTESQFIPRLINREGNIFRFQIDITEYTGNKYSRIYEIDTSNGTFEEK